MQYAEAREKLKHGGEWAELAEAVGVVIAAPECSELDLFLALRHGGVIAEQAALALYRKTQTPIPTDRSKIATTTDGWVELIVDGLLCIHPDGSVDRRPKTSNPITLKKTPTPADVESLNQLRMAISSWLDRPERLFLILYYYEEMRFDQIAPILDMTEDRLRKMHHEIIERLRTAVGSDAQPLSRLFQDVSR